MRSATNLRFAYILPVAVLLCSIAHAQEVSCHQTAVSGSFGAVKPWKADKAIGFRTAGLAVDADGAPSSYRVDGKGLSETCDGVVAVVDGKRVTPKTDPAHWYARCKAAWNEAQSTGDFSNVAIFGFLTGAKNQPIVQELGDPLPGAAYISTTSMIVPGTPDKTQRHWVDAETVPYIVLPSGFLRMFKVTAGDLAIVYRPKTQMFAFAIFADGGDLGEASVRLHRDLKHDPVVTRNGVARAGSGIGDPVITLVFPGINVRGTTDADDWNKRIQTAGQAALAEWGGLPRLQACARQ